MGQDQRNMMLSTQLFQGAFCVKIRQRKLRPFETSLWETLLSTLVVSAWRGSLLAESVGLTTRVEYRPVATRSVSIFHWNTAIPIHLRSNL